MARISLAMGARCATVVNGSLKLTPFDLIPAV
jgi:hypothetical protein